MTQLVSEKIAQRHVPPTKSNIEKMRIKQLEAVLQIRRLLKDVQKIQEVRQTA